MPLNLQTKKELEFEAFDQIISTQTEMMRDVIENRSEGTYADRVVIRNCYVMRSLQLGRQTDMTPGLTSRFIFKRPQSLHQALTGNVSRQSHVASISSLTKCSRITFGFCSGS